MSLKFRQYKFKFLIVLLVYLFYEFSFVEFSFVRQREKTKRIVL